MNHLLLKQTILYSFQPLSPCIISYLFTNAHTCVQSFQPHRRVFCRVFNYTDVGLRYLLPSSVFCTTHASRRVVSLMKLTTNSERLYAIRYLYGIAVETSNTTSNILCMNKPNKRRIVILNNLIIIKPLFREPSR